MTCEIVIAKDKLIVNADDYVLTKLINKLRELGVSVEVKVVTRCG